MSKINILIADDHKLIRETWSYILNSDSRFQVIAECGDAQEAVELAKTKRPHVVLMDINIGNMINTTNHERSKECISICTSDHVSIGSWEHPKM